MIVGACLLGILVFIVIGLAVNANSGGKSSSYEDGYATGEQAVDIVNSNSSISPTALCQSAYDVDPGTLDEDDFIEGCTDAIFDLR